MKLGVSIMSAVVSTCFLLPTASAAEKRYPVDAQMDAKADLIGPDGAARGTVSLYAASDGVLLRAKVTGFEKGTHAFHIHETGACTPDLTAAGGHFNATNAEHGVLNPKGPHLGDLPNFNVQTEGETVFDVFAPNVTLEPGDTGTLLDDDGSAIVIHAGADDYKTNPAGGGGTRVACGVIKVTE